MLVNYTKYAQKSRRELAALLADRDNLFVITCRKCFREFDALSVPEGAEAAALVTELGKRLTGCAELDFLCSPRTQKAFPSLLPPDTENVLVLSCGLGVQTVAGLTELPVFTAADSVDSGGHHGMALTEKKCGGCGQCFLEATGGICPVTDCAKGLVNGQCGGAKNGKCEADSQKDCAWEKIYQRLEKQGRTREFLSRPVQLRDHSRVSLEQIKAWTAEVRERRTEGFPGGVHPEERKEATAARPLERFPAPEILVLPMRMHIGTAAVPTVRPGDAVHVGQVIGERSGFVSARIHSSISGTVVAVEPRPHPAGGNVLSVVIRNDGRDTLHESVRPGKPMEELNPEEIARIAEEKGIVGMGGATFPTAVKLAPGKPIDTVILNGSECEPYLTADHRVMLECPEDVIFGLRAMMKAVSASEGVILIEDNKPDAIKIMEEKTAAYPNIRVFSARTKYPEGAEKILIQRVLGRQVPGGKLPADVGCVVSNVSTARALSDAIQRGMPLIERAVTVTGECIRNPGNFLVRIGTPVSALLAHRGMDREDAEIKMGGPMMGTPILDADVPVLKGSNGILAVERDPANAGVCIRCGRCIDVCPMDLEPMNIAKYTEASDAEMLKKLHVLDCISCRCCEYICAAKLPLAEKIAAGKKLAMDAGKR